MAYTAQKKSAQAVLNWYEDQDESAFVVYTDYKVNPNKIYFVYRGTDKQEGAAALGRLLQEIEPTDNNTYYLQTQSGSGRKAAPGCGCTFSLYHGAGAYHGSAYNANNEILSTLRGIESRLSSLEEDEGEEDEDPQPQQNILAGIVNSPQMQTAIVNFLTGIVGNFVKPGPAPVRQVAGIDEDTAALQKAIELLMSKGVTIADIEKLAAMDQGQINFLLTMLRK